MKLIPDKTFIPLTIAGILLSVTAAGSWSAAWFASNISTRVASLEVDVKTLLNRKPGEYAGKSCPVHLGPLSMSEFGQ